MKYLCAGLSLLFFLSCSSKKVPARILQPDQMEAILWEQMKADAFAKEIVVKDSSRNPAEENRILQEKIFQKYKTDKAAFYESYDWYLAHDDVMKKVLDSILAMQGREKEHDRTKKFLKFRNHGKAKEERL